MDKATRILNILTLLLNGHVVTQEDLDRFTSVSKNLFNVILIQLIHFYESHFGEAIILKLSIIIN